MPVSGHRVRLGVLVPPGNPTVEAELCRMAPPGVSLHFARLEAPGAARPPGAAQGMEERTRAYLAALDGPARSIGAVQPAVVLLAHTASSYATGFHEEPRLIERLAAQTGTRALTAARAIVDALGHLRVRRLALGTPYPEAVAAQGRAYWEAAGFVVVNHRRLEGIGNIYDETEERAAALARAADTPAAEAVLLSGTGLPTVGVLEALERELGKPVLSSNQASLWRAIEEAGVEDPVPGFGRLLWERGPAGGADRAGAAVRGFHAHVYFDPATREAAGRVRDRLVATFPVDVRWRDAPIGPHPKANFRVRFAPAQLGPVVSWLMLHRAGLDVLVHPDTGEHVGDHSARALWLGTPLPVDLDSLRRLGNR